METESAKSSVTRLQSTVLQLRDELKECKDLVVELNSLQAKFQSKVSCLVQQICGPSSSLEKMEASKREKENFQQVPHCLITLTDSETQTSDILHRRWNSDLSLDQDGKSNGKRYQGTERSDFVFGVSSENFPAPIIRIAPQRKAVLKSKFTNKLDVGSHFSKRPADNMLLSDLGLTTQAPEFSQSEFNLSSDDHWSKENQKSSGRVRFLSHDDGQSCLNPQSKDDLDERDLCLPSRNEQIYHSHSGSWTTLTQSERDLSELDSNLSLNYVDGNESKPYTSTPCKGLRSKLKQSVSFHELLPSKNTQSMPNLPKPLRSSAGESLESTAGSNVHSSTASKRHSMINMEHRSQSFSINRRSSLTVDIDSGPYVPSAITSLFLGGRVKALHGGHLVVTGVVWYRGKLPGINDDVVGIEIDQVGLGNDGTFQGHRYFRCSPGRGLFVPFRKIIMAWPPPPSN